MKRKVLSLLLTLVLCLSLVPLTAVPAYAADYDLWVAGVQVTDDNLVIDSTDNADITSGSATYDPSMATLTLNNFNWSGKYKMSSEDTYTAIVAKQNLTIQVVGDNNLLMDVSTNARCNTYTIYVDGYKLSFEGDGSLTLGTVTPNMNHYEGYSAAIIADVLECTENFSGSLNARPPSSFGW